MNPGFEMVSGDTEGEGRESANLIRCTAVVGPWAISHGYTGSRL
jgi:hypothetical protein